MEKKLEKQGSMCIGFVDLAIVAEDKELNESLEEWKETFKQHGLRVNLEKTEVLSIGACRELNIKLEGRTIRQNNSLPTLVEQ